jgi:hypothetical protein
MSEALPSFNHKYMDKFIFTFYNWTFFVGENLLTEHRVMKGYWGRGGIAPHILDLGNRR